MKNSKKSKIELLAPAGDFECLVAAVNAGADAIYFGLTEFNMRSRAKNFKIPDLPKIKKICDEKKVKKELGLSRRDKVDLIISMGYPEGTEIREKDRKALSDIVRFI